MKIGVSTLGLYPEKLEDIFVLLEDIDVNYCEIINEYPYDFIDHDLVGSYSLDITIHAPLSDINLASSNEAIRISSISQIKNSIETASKLNSEIVVVHPGYVPTLARKFKEKVAKNSHKSLKECSHYAEDCGISMCIENMPDISELLLKDVNELAEMVEELDVYMTLDVGHAHTMNFNVEDMLRSERIKHIHLSDNDGSYDDHNAIGSDGVDFELLFEKLYKIRYRDILIIEVKNLDEILESLEFLRNLKVDKQ